MEREFGNYRLLEKLGEGAMGEVYKGLDMMLEREVAIKLLRPELSNRQDIVERFRTEAVALARLQHTNIATLYSFLPHGDQYFMVMEFVRGESLARLIERRRSVPWEEALKLISQALEGLEHAHRLGVVHRDIKPANMMQTYAGVLKLMDFGIARILERSRLTKTGHLVGTLEYMSPEQIAGQDTDARADIYAIGVVLYELLTGRIPFEKDSDYDLIRSQVEEPPKPPRGYVAELPLALEEAVLRALEKKPQDRFQSAALFRSTLLTILDPERRAQASDGPHKAPAETRLASRSQSTMGSSAAASIANRQSGQTKVQALPSEPRHLGDAPPARPEPRTTRRKNYPGVFALLVLLGLTGGLIAVVDFPQRPTPSSPTAEGEQNQTSLNPDLSKISLIEEQNAIKKPEDSALVPNLGHEEVDAILKRSPSLIPLPSVEEPLNPPEQEPPAVQRQRTREKVAQRRETRPKPKPKPAPQWEIIRGETRAVH